MEKSRIEWCDYTWNPVTGCKNNCPYCYAEKLAMRFCGDIRRNKIIADYTDNNGIYEIENEIIGRNGRSVIYPFGFAPTLHKNRLTKNCKPEKIKQGSTIFVCSTADLFGEWVPEEWIEKVFKVCEENPQHRYAFLTKNPKRYYELDEKRKLPLKENMWYGTTVTMAGTPYFKDLECNIFVSIEPMQGQFQNTDITGVDWVIVGAETGQRRSKILPKKTWISEIVSFCKERNLPVFLKNNLEDIWEQKLIQQFPWE